MKVENGRHYEMLETIKESMGDKMKKVIAWFPVLSDAITILFKDKNNKICYGCFNYDYINLCYKMTNCRRKKEDIETTIHDAVGVMNCIMAESGQTLRAQFMSQFKGTLFIDSDNIIVPLTPFYILTYGVTSRRCIIFFMNYNEQSFIVDCSITDTFKESKNKLNCLMKLIGWEDWDNEYFNIAINSGYLIPYQQLLKVLNNEQMDSIKEEINDVYETGAVREANNGRGRYDLISPYALERIAKRCEFGAKKYSDRNWEKGGIPNERYLCSALRHITEYMQGLKNEDHLAAAVWNLMAIMHFEEVNHE